ncbi:PP2C family serine/threonine-protein phosphatase [Roseofilum casamattae]|uniref:PP2C family serine/threonine-protein phosphatase n=1 Tax=Roseofilum casamattae BLCC-M143 TaxID=3022442 RepID=A0ABT7BUT4_9CYAN|nr:PP2C family serine/threonine-protein phosphatase [Roseofilum casamattae]MDJ1182951.1 PP2C family serine/threonine-protein phosphatase [Roseofilum casamattae BLCC-M143]
MPQLDENLEKLVQAVCWKLYLEENHEDLQETWDRALKGDRDRLHKVIEQLSYVFAEFLKYKFNLASHLPEAEAKAMNAMWNHHKIDRDVKQIICDRIKAVLSQKTLTLPLQQDWSQYNKTKPASVGIQPMSGHVGVSPPQNIEPEDETKDSPVTPENSPVPIAQWNYLPIPEDEPECHDESYAQSEVSPDRLKLIGARVRGKMHKHNGTNCDDWFEFAVSGHCTIIAVADGAGSKKFSRIGAKVSCQTAVKYLSEKLRFLKIPSKGNKEELIAALDRNEQWVFPEQGIDYIQQKLHKAMELAHQAVAKKADECKEQTSYFISLNKGYAVEAGRRPEIKDFACTLLLAVHTTVQVAETEYNLVLSCQVGDGTIAAISAEGTASVLSKPDSGEYAGQTEFITSKSAIDPEILTSKVSVFAGRLKTLMVMTDGVADDYFPSNPGMLELYGNLALNRILPLPQPNDEEIERELSETELISRGKVREVLEKFHLPEQVMTANGSAEINISDLSHYAQVLGRSSSEVTNNSTLLWTGANVIPIDDNYQNQSRAERLETWLNFYYRRGSFDDRTLVILYRDNTE